MQEYRAGQITALFGLQSEVVEKADVRVDETNSSSEEEEEGSPAGEELNETVQHKSGKKSSNAAKVQKKGGWKGRYAS